MNFFFENPIEIQHIFVLLFTFCELFLTLIHFKKNRLIWPRDILNADVTVISGYWSHSMKSHCFRVKPPYCVNTATSFQRPIPLKYWSYCYNEPLIGYRVLLEVVENFELYPAADLYRVEPAHIRIPCTDPF